MELQNISPAAYSLLQNSQPPAASVQRSFSMLKKLLAKNRNFKAENVKHYNHDFARYLVIGLQCYIATVDLFCNPK